MSDHRFRSIAIVLAAALIALGLVGNRYELTDTGERSMVFKLDTWTGRVNICVRGEKNCR